MTYFHKFNYKRRDNSYGFYREVSINNSHDFRSLLYSKQKKRIISSSTVSTVKKRDLIQFTHLNGIDEKTSIDINKPVQQPTHQ